MVIILGLLSVVVMSTMAALILWQEGHRKFVPLAIGVGLSLSWLIIHLATYP